MSIRPDVLPPPVMKELAKLQDRIEPFSTDEARAMIEADLGSPIDTIFSEFSIKPIAAASLAQVTNLRSSSEAVFWICYQCPDVDLEPEPNKDITTNFRRYTGPG